MVEVSNRTRVTVDIAGALISPNDCRSFEEDVFEGLTRTSIRPISVYRMGRTVYESFEVTPGVIGNRNNQRIYEINSLKD